MFEFNRELAVGKSAANIVTAREDLIYDDYPVLFTGLNMHGSRIVGSYIANDLDSEDEIVYYLHIVVSHNSFQYFVNRVWSYRDLIEETEEVYINAVNYDEGTEVFYTLATSDFAKDYLPTNKSLYPESHIKPGLDYTLRLTGNLADENRADTKQASAIAVAFSLLLEQSVNSLKLRRIRALQVPSTDGSFKLNFEVRFQEGSQLPIGGEDAVALFQTRFLDYCINSLGAEVAAVFTDGSPNESMPGYISLREAFKQLHQVLGKSGKEPLTEESIDKLLKKDISKAASNLSKATADLGNSFNAIEVSNSKATAKRIISTIDAEAKIRISYVADYIESADKDFEEDTEPKDYKITIYNLNTDNRSGNAVVFTGERDEVMSRPRIKITGKEPLEQTEFTNSLHSGTPIHVQGKARRIGSKLLSIEVINE